MIGQDSRANISRIYNEQVNKSQVYKFTEFYNLYREMHTENSMRE